LPSQKHSANEYRYNSKQNYYEDPSIFGGECISQFVLPSNAIEGTHYKTRGADPNGSHAAG
jgi:hypothetical protein